MSENGSYCQWRPNYEDNWVDIIGYSQLALNEIRNNKTATGSLKV